MNKKNRKPIIGDKKGIEEFAKVLHEGNREAVLANKVHKKDGASIGQIQFINWSDLSEDAREERRIQARYVLDQFSLVPHKSLGRFIKDLREIYQLPEPATREEKLLKIIDLVRITEDWKFFTPDPLDFIAGQVETIWEMDENDLST